MFNRLQARFHPDLGYSSANASNCQSQQDMQQHSACINEAFATLKRPLSRAKHLFSLVCKEDYEQAAQKLMTDHQYLTKIMAIDEQIEEYSSLPKKLRQLQQELEIDSEVAEANFVEAVNEKECKKAIECLSQWNFYDNRRSKIRDMLF